MARGMPALIANSPTLPLILEPLKRISFLAKDSGTFPESYLQELLDLEPRLLPVRDFYQTVTSLFSLGREIPVDLGGHQGYIDNLFVTNDAHLVLVETKLHRNPTGIREVVAQTFQYGEAINRMSLMQLEECIRKGDRKSRQILNAGETILARVNERAETDDPGGLIEDFEDKLETHIRTGNLLYLIVADGIRASVERMTYWLNEIAGSAPHKFGLIELRFYKCADGKSVVIPRTLVRTKEISRHVIEVNIQGEGGKATAVVKEQSEAESGGTSIAERPVRTAGPPLTKDRLLAEAKAKSNDAYVVVEELVHALDSLGLDTRALGSTLQYGLLYPKPDGDFYPLISLQPSSLWSHIPTKLIAVLGDAAFVEHKRALNAVAPFYRPGEVNDPAKKMSELMPPYELLKGRVRQLVDAIRATRDKALSLLEGSARTG